jgi:cytochrome c peroxidase
MITGNCADIGKVKGPILRGLAARAPYFHNGSAATLMDVVNFYDKRFAIGFTSDQKQDPQRALMGGNDTAGAANDQ